MQGICLTLTAATAGEHIDWMMTSPAAIRLTDFSKVVQVARNCPFFFSSISLSIVKSISGFCHIALVAVLDQIGAFKAQRGIHDPNRGHIEDRGIALIFRVDQLLPLRDLVTDEV